MNIYVKLTQAFNEGGLRAVLSSGQAVVFHQLTVMSKGGDGFCARTRERCCTSDQCWRGVERTTALVPRLTCGGCEVDGVPISSFARNPFA